MQKEIKYNGFTETPSDYECPDGDLATVEGMVQEEEALRPVLPPKQLFRLPTGYKTAFIHKNSGYVHYIIQYGNALYWFDESLITAAVSLPVNITAATLATATATHGPLLLSSTTILSVNAIGNTLVILSEDEMNYILWKGLPTTYAILGGHMPEIQISFGLRGAAAENMQVGVDIPENVYDTERERQGYVYDIPREDLTYITDDFINALTEPALAGVNKFIAKHYLEEGKFIFPFIVRYAYRLYDESLVMHSAPVLMITDSYTAPHFFLDTKEDFHLNCLVGAMLYDLDYKASDIADLRNNWGDIVKSVDIFVSAPLYTYNQAGKVKGQKVLLYDDAGYGIFNVPSDSGIYNVDIDNTAYSKWWTLKLLTDKYGAYELPGLLEYVLPHFDEEEFNEKVRSCQNFYLLKSIRTEDLNTSRTVISIPENFFGSLVNRELMTDDFDSHDQLIPRYAQNYNSRMHLANISKQLSNPFVPSSLVTFTNKSYSDYGTVMPTSSAVYMVYVFIRQDGKEFVMGSPSSESMGFDMPYKYFYYPNPNAYKAVVARAANGVITHYELPLRKHDFLNGAVYFEGFGTVPATTSAPTETTGNIVRLPNKIYTSEVDNPFVFTALGITTVGFGSILGISAAVKALSQGQFGQFPLYAFTDEGVWALEVSSQGSFSARQPVTRDVCISQESITQIDTAVLFASKRGIMMLSGSNAQCISDTINSDAPFNINNLAGLSGKGSAHMQLRNYIEGCRMLYDYTHQRIIVYNPAKTYAYVYSLKSKTWATMPSTIKDSLNSYPDAFAEVNVTVQSTVYNTVVNFSDEMTGVTTGFSGVLVTRPIKLDAPDILKTVDTVIQRGYFRKGHVKSVIYGSRDLFNWHLVFSSEDHYLRGFRGTPYKYFRIALLCTLDKDESIFGCTVQFAPRHVNQPR